MPPTVAPAIRHDWTRAEVRALFDPAQSPLMDLVFRAAQVHRQFHDAAEVQVCKLISIKTGGCPEDCSYCSQSARYETEIKAQPLMPHDEVMQIAHRAKASGVTRVCMGAAWREVRDNAQFDKVLDMVKDVTALGLEVCCTLGMLTEHQAQRLEAAGLYAYNHNIDTSAEHYETIITTRTFQDRLDTLANVRKTDVTVCCGGIMGLGETVDDRVSMLHTLATMTPHPESVPVNVLAKVPGTPMENAPDVPIWDTVRLIAVARLLMPRATVRLSAGRSKMSFADQAMCFMAGANSIFSSETRVMLTRAVPSPDYDADKAMLDVMGLRMRPPFKDGMPEHVVEAAGGSLASLNTLPPRIPFSGRILPDVSALPGPMNARLSTDLAPSEPQPDHPPAAVITGIGLVTPLGVTAPETWHRLLAGHHITDHARAAGEFDPHTPRVIQLARRAAAEALANAGWSPDDDYATIVGTSKGSIESWLTPLTPLQHIPHSAYVAGGLTPTGLADIAATLASPRGPRLTLSGACASGLMALIRAAMLIESGQAHRVLVVAAESSLHPLFLGSFQRLGVFPRPGIGCRPFDEAREGFLMSEAAAALCLEASTATPTNASQAPTPVSGRTGGALRLERGTTPNSCTRVPSIAISHYALGGDGHHLTAGDPSAQLLRHLIYKVTSPDQPVDLIHAHGTGTITNDPIELAALDAAFATASPTPCLYSHKGALGHSLGAAGLVSVVLNCLAHQHHIIPPNVRTTHPLPAHHLQIHPHTLHRPIQRSIALAAGFGGATAAITLSS